MALLLQDTRSIRVSNEAEGPAWVVRLLPFGILAALIRILPPWDNQPEAAPPA